MKLSKAKIVALILILISYAVGLYYYSKMPTLMASHWDAQGNVNGYTEKFWAVFLMPIISTVLFAFFLAIPAMDPKKNIEKFKKYFDQAIILIIAFLFYVNCLSIVWNLGKRFDFTTFMLPAFAILFYYLGVVIENAKPNWFIGIRTPWTLSSDSVWEKTHKLGGKLYKVAAVISVFGIFIPKYTFLFIVIPIISVSLYSVIFSYLEFAKESKGK